MALQGFPIEKLKIEELQSNGICMKDFLGALGNSMSINVLMRLLPRLLKCSGLRKRTNLTEYDKLPLAGDSS